MNVYEVRERLGQLVDATAAAHALWRDCPACAGKEPPSYMRAVLEMVDALIERALFQVDQRVVLRRTPEINSQHSWGWRGAKHFLVQGASATVRSVHFLHGRFWYNLAFDDDSWVDAQRAVHPTKLEDRGLYAFSEDDLGPLDI
jgi:hypothetical protein